MFATKMCFIAFQNFKSVNFKMIFCVNYVFTGTRALKPCFKPEVFVAFNIFFKGGVLAVSSYVVSAFVAISTFWGRSAKARVNDDAPSTVLIRFDPVTSCNLTICKPLFNTDIKSKGLG